MNTKLESLTLEEHVAQVREAFKRAIDLRREAASALLEAEALRDNVRREYGVNVLPNPEPRF